MGHWIKNIGLLAIGTFLMVLVSPGNFAPVWASEKGVLKENAPGSLDLRVENGKVTGQFQQWPVSKVLDSLLGPMSIEYHAREELLDHPVSATLDQVPLNDALKTVLDPFNYLVLTGAGQNIKSLHILGLKSGPPVGLPGPQESLTARVPPDPVNRDLHAFGKKLESLKNSLAKEKNPASEADDSETNQQPPAR